MLDLVEGGSSWEEVVQLAKAIEAAGATLINTGIGWHEARIPTIATMVPRAAFAWVTKRLKGAVKIPLITTNRINTPEVAERGVGLGQRRHGLDGPPLPRRCRFREQGGGQQGDEINTCIACNQACLDHIFNGKLSSPAWSIRAPVTRPS
jgi:2,4-dienoyl-CoA reductase (NADPH2)